MSFQEIRRLFRNLKRAVHGKAKAAPRRTVRPHLEALEERTVLSTLTVVVTSAADDGSNGTLRNAIDYVNYWGSLYTACTIHFAIGDPGSAQTITLNLGALAPLRQAVTIDGASQGGSPGQGPLIALNGNGISSDGLAFYGMGGSRLLDLAIYNFVGNGVVLDNPAGTPGDVLSGCYVGADAAGDAGVGNTTGVLVEGPNDVVGDATGASKTIVSGNTQDGIDVSGANAVNDLITNVWAGVGLDGLTALGNLGNGLSLMNATSAVVARDVFSGNYKDGLFIIAGDGALVRGSQFGVGANGVTKAANLYNGLELGEGVVNCNIGTSVKADRNVIAGNGQSGLKVAGASSNHINNNYIGLDAHGNRQGNGAYGILLTQGLTGGGASGNTIGDKWENVISGNGSDGVRLTGSGVSQNLIVDNSIGINTAGTSAKDANGASTGNGGDGIRIDDGASNNTVGGTALRDSNVISGNTGSGVMIGGVNDVGTTKNLIQGDYIGVDTQGQTAVANQGDGVTIENSNGNTIGALSPTGGAIANIISGNADSGVDIISGANNLIVNSYIGVGKDGGFNGTKVDPIPNHGDGVLLQQSASNNTIGGLQGTGALNVISGNDGGGSTLFGFGVAMQTDSTNNVVEGNYIGVASDGATAEGNANDGVYAEIGSGGNTIGGTVATAKNVISANGGWGVELKSTSNLVDWDYIGVDSTGAAGPGLPNKSGAVSAVPGNTIGTHNKP